MARWDDAMSRKMTMTQQGGGTLGTCLDPWIVFTCPQCGRRGEYKRESMLAEFGPDVSLPDLRLAFAARRGCPMAMTMMRDPGANFGFDNQCRIQYDIER